MFLLTYFAVLSRTVRGVGRKRGKLGKKGKDVNVIVMRRRVMEIVDVLTALLARHRLNSGRHWSLASFRTWAFYAQRRKTRRISQRRIVMAWGVGP